MLKFDFQFIRPLLLTYQHFITELQQLVPKSYRITSYCAVPVDANVSL